MEFEIKIDSSRKEPKIIILAPEINDEINSIAKKLSQSTSKVLTGFKGDKLKILNYEDVFRFYTANTKVFAQTTQGEYLLKLRLYELEKKLDHELFVRISNSEIINLRKVKTFDLSFTGTICVFLLDGTVTYASRRYVSKIKQVLGI